MRRMIIFALGATALAAVAIGVGSPPAHASIATQRVVVRPVHANGTPVHGYTVTREDEGSGFLCRNASWSAVDPNIYFCGWSASNTVSCWKSTNHTVLCLRDPRVKQLVRIRYDGTITHVAARRRPSPQELLLGIGNKCLIRIGGAWASPPAQPTWVGWYFCWGHFGDVYGPRGGDGINRSHSQWTVYTTDPIRTRTITTRRVAIAYYVGTAR